MLERKKEDIELAKRRVPAFRGKPASRTDKKNKGSLRATPLKEGELVLVYDVVRSNNFSREAKFRPWNGPLRTDHQGMHTKAYRLATLDGIKLPNTCTGDRLKAFYVDKRGRWASPDDDKLLARPGESDVEDYLPRETCPGKETRKKILDTADQVIFRHASLE
jgi:hypothetical protein